MKTVVAATIRTPVTPPIRSCTTGEKMLKTAEGKVFPDLIATARQSANDLRAALASGSDTAAMSAVREKTAAYVTALYDVTVLLYRSPIADSSDAEIIDAEVVSDSAEPAGVGGV